MQTSQELGCWADSFACSHRNYWALGISSDTMFIRGANNVLEQGLGFVADVLV